MIARLGNVLYFVALFVAALMLLAGTTKPDGMQMFGCLSFVAFVIGWAIRYILTGNGSPLPWVEKKDLLLINDWDNLL